MSKRPKSRTPSAKVIINVTYPSHTNGPAKKGAAMDWTFSQATVLPRFLALCRQAIDHNERIYVFNRAGKYYLTLDPEKGKLRQPIIDVTAQEFKDNFARFSTLIEIGMSFRLLLRSKGTHKHEAYLYARRHTHYRYELDYILEQWREHFVQTGPVRALVAEIKDTVRDEGDNVDEKLDKIMRGVARLAIGHLPFGEGELPKPDDRPQMPKV